VAAIALGLLASTSAGAADSADTKLLVYPDAARVAADLTGDQRIWTDDLAELTAALGHTTGDSGWSDIAHLDTDADGAITAADVAALSQLIIYDDGDDFDLIEATVLEIQSYMAAGTLTSVELTQAYLDRIQAYDQAQYNDTAGTELSSILAVNPDALTIAAELDQERATTGPRGLLHGIPVIVKDNYNTVGMPTTMGCKCFEQNFSPDNAFLVEQLQAEGAIILAKSNLAEFAFGTDGRSAMATTTNAYIPGGASGGSSAGTGASISANFAVFGLGTDTGGSIRIPSSYNGLVGFRPTVGLLSRDGIAPLALSQDTGGPMARSVADVAVALDAMAASDPNDAVTAQTDSLRPDSYISSLDANGLEGARIGYVSATRVPTGTNGSATGTNAEVLRLYQQAQDDMEAAGATLVDIGYIPLVTTTSGSTAEFAHDLDAYLAQYAGPGMPTSTAAVRDIIYPLRDPDDPTSGRVSSGLSVVYSSFNSRVAPYPINTPYGVANNYDEWMVAHNQEITTNRAGIDALLAGADGVEGTADDLDAIIEPPVTAFAAGGGSAGSNNRISALTGHPSLSVPMGYSEAADASAGASINVEFLGRRFDEPTLLKLAYAYEQATQHRHAPERYPALTGTSTPAPVSTMAAGSSEPVEENYIIDEMTVIEPTADPPYTAADVAAAAKQAKASTGSSGRSSIGTLAATATSVALSASAGSAQVGETVTVTATGTVSDLYAYSLTLSYDPAVLEYVADSATGPSGGFTQAQPGSGAVTLLHTRLGTSPGLEGSQQLGTAKFKVIGVGASPVSTTSGQLIDAALAPAALTSLGSAVAIQGVAPIAPSPSASPSTSATPSASPTVGGPSDDPSGSSVTPSATSTKKALAVTGSNTSPNFLVLAAALAGLGLGLTAMFGRRRFTNKLVPAHRR
jgi:Asp-tRNA(Asn)/Glu-tRNA(Gln) amidotransferase A subunit family amidase